MGFAVELAPGTRVSSGGGLLLGGSPSRLLRLDSRGARLIRAGRFEVWDAVSARLARKLLDIGAVNPRPPRDPVRKVTIVIPTKDRAAMVDRLLSALRIDPQTSSLPVIVVDDGSERSAALRQVGERHGALVLRHERSTGPAAARNTGLRAADTEFVAFCDSDVVPQRGWLGLLLAQFADDKVALAAPRIVPLLGRCETMLERFEQECSPLDLGWCEAPIVPMSPVAYVPSASLAVRKSAVESGFAGELRVAEDVDLCLRLHEHGWRLRYVPSARVAHEHRTDLRSWLAQRAFYGTGAAVLSKRHPGQVAPVHVRMWSLLACLLLGTGHRWALVAACGLVSVNASTLIRRMPDADRPVRAGVVLTASVLRSTAQQLVRSATRHHWPIGVLLALSSCRARRVLLVASLVEGLLEHRARGSSQNPLAHVFLRRLDDLAYGSGVWWSALRHRTLAPLLPRIVVRGRAPAASCGRNVKRRWIRR